MPRSCCCYRLGMKTFLVTGASKGIGFSISARLAEAGHKVIGIARHVPPSFPGSFFPGDLSDEKETASLLEQIEREHLVDGIINNVGIVGVPSFAENVEIAAFRSVMDLNLVPALQTAGVFLPRMKSQRWGRVINISSISALGARERTAYAAAKSALNAITVSWALELAPFGVTVNAVAPGPVETDLFRVNNPQGSKGEARYLAMVPMNRLGTPAEIAGAVNFLASDEASFITGHVLTVDGGASAGI